MTSTLPKRRPQRRVFLSWLENNFVRPILRTPLVYYNSTCNLSPLQQMNFNIRVGIKCSPGLHQTFFIPLRHVQIFGTRSRARPIIKPLHIDDVSFDLPHLTVMVDLPASI